MPRITVNDYRLSPAAQRDLDQIWDYTVNAWSLDQAEIYLHGLQHRFEQLCEFPLTNRERMEIKPPVRVHAYEHHLIIYRLEEGCLVILRVVHNRSRWQGFISEM